MAEKYQVRKFEPVNNSSYQFFEVSVNGKFQFQEFVNNLKDEQRDLKKLNAIYGYMDSLSSSNLLPKTKFRHIECKKCKNVYEFKRMIFVCMSSLKNRMFLLFLVHIKVLKSKTQRI